MKYFVFNKTSDYTRGYGEHMTYHSKGICVEKDCQERASFWSRILDSVSAGTLWHRLTCNIPKSGGAMMRISFYTSDDILLEEGDKTLDIKEVLHAEQLTLSQKKEICQPFLRKQLPLEPDILLHSLKGRYLWFLLEIYPQGAGQTEIGDFMVYFPTESWSADLPEIYRRDGENDSFLNRFLAIFQSLYDDTSRQIKEFVNCLDPGVAAVDLLHSIASWLDVEEPYMWTEGQLRYLLAHTKEFFETRGTAKGIEMYVKLYTGETPFVIEYQDWEGFQDSYGGLLKSLYEDEPYRVTVLVREECIPTYKDHCALLRMLKQVGPVQMEIRLVVLKPYIFADEYSYLGVNTVLGQYEGAALDRGGRLDFTAISDE
ncbi:MAG: hypothetical protein J1E65_08140 [Lachnospiraceae bacterium]|nr:hypothetical protein [Lachnospiraceae bacterium]